MRNIYWFTLLFVHCFTLCNGIEENTLSFTLPNSSSSKPLYEVASLGALTTGALIEGMVGAIHKGARQRFYCHSTGPEQGFLGHQTSAKLLSLENQPGVFPAPLMGPASLAFTFHCKDVKAPLTPIVIRPDGTVFRGLPMTSFDSPQTLEISSPAQTGIYTLFIVAHHKDDLQTQMMITTHISTEPKQSLPFYIQPFDPNAKDMDLISAEFVYSHRT